MSTKLRALLIALIVVAVGGALYGGYRSGFGVAHATAGESALPRFALPQLFDPGITDQRLVELAFREVERAYYKPVKAQTLMGGERAGILALLKHERVSGAVLPAIAAGPDTVSDLHAIGRELSYAQAHYGTRLGTRGDARITHAALRGLMDSLGDPYTVYLSPREIRSLNESLRGGDFGGIGVYIYQLKGGEIVLQPIAGSPASKAGIKPGAVIVRVDATPVSGLSLNRVERLIRGPKGSVVTITTHPYRATKLRAYRIVREIIHVPTVHAKMEDGFEYVRLSDFGTTSAAEVRRALLEGKARGAKGYILDLRDNGGGLLDAAVQISSLFIPHGTIVSTINRLGEKDEQEALGDAIPGLSPLVVLVNGYTASSSEITSGAIQDYKIGTLIGTRTFGKGVVQSIYPMPNSSALKITTARYVTPLGRDIEHVGIEPDIVVKQNPDPALIGTRYDKQLAAAVARLRRIAR